MKNKKMVRNIIYSLCVVFFSSSIILGFYLNKKIENVNSLNNQLKVEESNRLIFKDFISYPISSFKEKVATGDTVFAYIGNAECPDCSTFYPILNKKVNES